MKLFTNVNKNGIIRVQYEEVFEVENVLLHTYIIGQKKCWKGHTNQIPN